MSCVSLVFLGSFFYLALFVTRQTLAVNPTLSTSGSSGLVDRKKCNNVYFYEAPNKKIESMLQAVTKQLTHMQNDINFLVGKKNATKGNSAICVLSIFSSQFFSFFHQVNDLSALSVERSAKPGTACYKAAFINTVKPSVRDHAKC